MVFLSLNGLKSWQCSFIKVSGSVHPDISVCRHSMVVFDRIFGTSISEISLLYTVCILLYNIFRKNEHFGPLFREQICEKV